MQLGEIGQYMWTLMMLFFRAPDSLDHSAAIVTLCVWQGESAFASSVLSTKVELAISARPESEIGRLVVEQPDHFGFYAVVDEP